MQNVIDLACLLYIRKVLQNDTLDFFPRIENIIKHGISKENNNIAKTQNKTWEKSFVHGRNFVFSVLSFKHLVCLYHPPILF